MPVDSFRFLPRLLAAFYQSYTIQSHSPSPWTALCRPLREYKFGLVTTAGLFHKGLDKPFDIEKEKQQPTWGDPSFRAIPVDILQAALGVSHLHINSQWIEEDINVQLPVQRFQELAAEGIIGGLADTAYSFMGFQGYPPDLRAWEKIYAPQVAQKFKEALVECVFLTPT